MKLCYISLIIMQIMKIIIIKIISIIYFLLKNKIQINPLEISVLTK